MSADTIDAEFRPLANVEQAPPPALFGTDDPVEIVQKAVRVADALKDVVASKGLISNIQGKAYPQVEAWQTLAAMLRLTSITEWTRPCENGWEARVVVRDGSGRDVGAGEAQCTRDERSWKSRDGYALRSMAQTRATSKALRSVLAFVMVLAGYQPTPAEEMPTEPERDETPAAEKKSANDPGSVSEESLAKVYRGFAMLSLTTDADIGAWLNAGTEGRIDDNARIRDLSENEARRVGKLLKQELDRRNTAGCDACNAPKGKPHVFDGLGVPCPNDTSAEALKWHAAHAERNIDTELPL